MARVFPDITAYMNLGMFRAVSSAVIRRVAQIAVVQQGGYRG